MEWDTIKDDSDLTITGLNVGLLSSELATRIAGRYVQFPVLPLTSREFLDFRGKTVTESTEEFRRYVRYGGLPGIHAVPLEDETVFPYLNGLYNTIVLKDEVSRNRILDRGQLDQIIRFVFANAGNITTAKRIADYLKSQRMTARLRTRCTPRPRCGAPLLDVVGSSE